MLKELGRCGRAGGHGRWITPRYLLLANPKPRKRAYSRIGQVGQRGKQQGKEEARVIGESMPDTDNIKRGGAEEQSGRGLVQQEREAKQGGSAVLRTASVCAVLEMQRHVQLCRSVTQSVSCRLSRGCMSVGGARQ